MESFSGAFLCNGQTHTLCSWVPF